MAKPGNAPVLFDPRGLQIKRAEWLELQKQDADPYIIKQFDNGKVGITLKAVSILYGSKDIPANFWKRFDVSIENIITTDPEGEPLKAPRRVIDPDSRQFILREDAETYYNQFLAKFTESKFDEETGALKEVGNIFTPPDPDVPVIAETSPVAEQFGSW